LLNSSDDAIYGDAERFDYVYKAETNKANPRANNTSGDIIEVTEANSDAAATTFAWDIFLLAGDPKDHSTYFAGYPKEKISPIGAIGNFGSYIASEPALGSPVRVGSP
jgi:secreted PhoX family phosphatase